MGKKSRRSNRNGRSSGHGKNIPMLGRRLIQLEKEASASKKEMLWSKAAHKYRECIEALQEIQDRIIENTESIDSHLLDMKATLRISLMMVEYSYCRYDKVIQIYNDIQISPEIEKMVPLFGFTSNLYGRLAMLRQDDSKENKDKLISFIDAHISEGMNDTDVFVNTLKVVRILRVLKEYDSAIALGEKLERLRENGDRAISENSFADIVPFENIVSHLERYRVEYDQTGKAFRNNILVRVQEVFNKLDEDLLRQRDAYFIMIAQWDYLCHQIDDKELSSQLCGKAIKYVETYLEIICDFERHCFTCIQADTATEVQLVCSGCRVACYCSLGHQRMTWKKDAIRGMRIGHEILCPLMKAYRKWKLVSKKGNERAMKLRRRLDRECLYFLSHGLGLKDKCFQETDVHTFYQSLAE